MSNPDDPASWVAKADNDLLCIANNLNDLRVPWDAVCFHAQQAAEKMFKAFLAGRGMTFTRTHNLRVLLTECVTAGASFAALESACDLLNPFAVTFRYPSGTPDPTEAEGHLAVSAARRVYDTVKAALILPP